MAAGRRIGIIAADGGKLLARVRKVAEARGVDPALIVELPQARHGGPINAEVAMRLQTRLGLGGMVLAPGAGGVSL